ncbi:RNA-directed DNA polymerase from mobile element jockey-like [Elysia marginata]|uniref:RNA-directed DNA polymerase from mobile element jockey-like n=1 Tax=Elysia marginata TaxID=1093978 RepID=A0AAV4IZU6_9GAST|nr:RNA-directed DNA polymerase from mobile element jockey-like [Elysia marginata]
MNTTKSVSTAFNHNNHKASKTLEIKVKNKTLPSDPNPKHLGVCLDRLLVYCKYLEGCAIKIAKRNCILRKLARTTRGASQSALRMSTFVLCYNAAECCAPVSTRSLDTKLVDVNVRASMRTKRGCLKPTPIQWLPTSKPTVAPPLEKE